MRLDKDVELFRVFLYDTFKSYGIGDVASQIFSLLYVVPKELSMEEIAKYTNYSLATISNTLRVLHSIQLINRIKRPGTKKIYLTVERNRLRLMKDKLTQAQEYEVQRVKKELPDLITRLKAKKNLSKELGIIQEYYDQTNIIDELHKLLLHKLEEYT